MFCKVFLILKTTFYFVHFKTKLSVSECQELISPVKIYVTIKDSLTSDKFQNHRLR